LTVTYKTIYVGSFFMAHGVVANWSLFSATVP